MIRSTAQMYLQSDVTSHRLIGFLLVAFMRLMSLVFLGFAIMVWLQLVGYWEGDQNRFDTMTTAMRTQTAILAVLFPVASVGLWSTLSWGRVVWYTAAGVQIIGSLFYRDMLGGSLLLVFFHTGCIIFYLILRLSMRLITKEE